MRNSVGNIEQRSAFFRNVICVSECSVRPAPLQRDGIVQANSARNKDKCLEKVRTGRTFVSECSSSIEVQLALFRVFGFSSWS